jgi:hypothetical protein
MPDKTPRIPARQKKHFSQKYTINVRITKLKIPLDRGFQMFLILSGERLLVHGPMKTSP